MSGPIVRKYGFPNFEKIFGERGLEHGADEPETPSAGAPEPPPRARTPGRWTGPENSAPPTSNDQAKGRFTSTEVFVIEI